MNKKEWYISFCINYSLIYPLARTKWKVAYLILYSLFKWQNLSSLFLTIYVSVQREIHIRCDWCLSVQISDILYKGRES